MYIESCDNNCDGCEKNLNGWCIWKNKSCLDKLTISKHNSISYPEGHPCKNCINNPANNPHASGHCNCVLPDIWNQSEQINVIFY